MSSTRQVRTKDGTAVAACRFGPQRRLPTHVGDRHQLSIAAEGVLVMGIGTEDWVLPRSRGLWIPAGVEHSVSALGTATMTALWFDPAQCPIRWTTATVIELTPLLRALITHLAEAHVSAAERQRADAVLFDLLRPLPSAVTIALPFPVDDRARRVADAVVADPADRRTLVDWGRRVGASDRTLLRSFRSETGLGFHEWRTRARVTAALPLLADGLPVQVVANQVGFGSASAFGAAFRRVVGASPSAYASPHPDPPPVRGDGPRGTS